MPRGFKLFYLSPFCIFLFYQTVSTLQMGQIQSFPEQKKVSFDSSRSQWSRISRGNKTVLLTNPASRHMNHTALPRALPFAIPSPPHRLAALLQLPPPLSVLKSFEAHMWAVGLISHHAGAVSACHECSVDNDRSLQHEPSYPATCRYVMFGLCPPRVWVRCTSSPGRAPCPLDSWRADVTAAGINSTKGLRKQGELESPCASQSGFGSVNSQNHKVNKSRKC